MSIDTELTRIENAKSSLRTALINQGQSVDADATLDSYPAKVSAIPSMDSLIDGSVNGNVESNVNVIKEGAFENCTFLTSVSFPNVEQIKTEAFKQCSNLQSVNIPNALSIQYRAFYYCENLRSIVLPQAGNIFDEAFMDCNLLKDIYLPNENVVCTIDVNSLPASSTHHITIHVPSSRISDYQNASNWSDLYNDGYIDFQAIA